MNKKALYKTLSWFILSGLLIASCNYYEYADISIAVKAAVLASLLKTPLYWLHESIWR